MSPYNTNLAEVATATEAGWRPDPTGRYEWRYWDGGWTNRVASSRSVASTPAASAASAVPAVAAVSAVPATAPAPEPAPNRGSGLVARGWRAFIGFFTAFVDEPESYHSDRVVDIDSDPRGERMLDASPANYGRAGLVALSACGIGVGSYLPWLSGTIDGLPFSQTGFEDGHGWSFTIGALALVFAALVGVRLRPLRWVAIALALLLAGLTFRELVHIHDVVTTMNASSSIEADVGTGLWIMAGCAVVALVASFRLGERE